MNHRLFAALAIGFCFGVRVNRGNGNVIPGEGGVYEVIATGEDKQETLSTALSAAENTCEKRQMRYVVIARQEAFKGVAVDSSKPGEVIAESIAATTAQNVWWLSGDGDYRLAMKFKCEI